MVDMYADRQTDRYTHTRTLRKRLVLLSMRSSTTCLQCFRSLLDSSGLTKVTGEEATLLLVIG